MQLHHSGAAAAPAAARCVVERSDEYSCTDEAYRMPIVEQVSKRAPSGSIVPFVLVKSQMTYIVFSCKI